MAEVKKEIIDTCVKAEKASERPWPFNKKVPDFCTNNPEIKAEVTKTIAQEKLGSGYAGEAGKGISKNNNEKRRILNEL